MIYSLIIIGAGAAGLYAGASLESAGNGLILEKEKQPGQKLLLTGGGQCNLTHAGSIKDFIGHYGTQGTRIRPVLYRHSNKSVKELFRKLGIDLITREDGNMFPSSLNSRDVMDALVKQVRQNGLELVCSSPVTGIERSGELFTVLCPGREYQCRKLLVTTGGCSYPATGSDGKFFQVIKNLGLNVIEPRPALVPVSVQGYPYSSCAGISFPEAELTILRNSEKNGTKKKPLVFRDALLLTHRGFSGPLILNHSRDLSAGDRIRLNYYPGGTPEVVAAEMKKAVAGNQKQLLTFLADFFKGDRNGSFPGLSKRFLETICRTSQVDPSEKVSRLSGEDLKKVMERILGDEYVVQRLGTFSSAMVTAGGVDLEEVDMKTMESKKIPGLYFAGEVLDVDGDTGGYNLQFAFSSAYIAANA